MSFFLPPPEGFHIAERNPDGTLKGKIDPAETKRRDERRKSAMDSYFAKSAQAQEKMRKAAAGIKEKPELHGPKDELDLVVMNLLADPAALDGKGSANLRTLNDEQRRARRRAVLDSQAVEARKHLDKVLKGDDEAPDYSWASVSDEELESILGEDDDDDPLADLWAQEGDE